MQCRIVNVTKTFDKEGGQHALANLSLTVEDGELMVIVGPSGCGKSTTLRCIAGLENVESGEIFLGSRNVTKLSPKDRDVAMVFQNYALYPHLKVRDNLEFGLRQRRVAKSEIRKRIDVAVEMLQIGQLLDRWPNQLSGGQQQRVAIGRAMVRHAKVFLLDEPLSNLDAHLRVQMRGEIKTLQRQLGMTTIFVTHDQEEAMSLGDRVAILRDGRLEQVGPPLELYRNPRNVFVASFIGSPSMNILNASLTERGVALGRYTLPLRNGAGALPAKGPVLLGVRPEAIVPDDDDGAAVTVWSVEQLGARARVQGVLSEAEAQSVVLEIPAVQGEQLQPGDWITCPLQAESILLFDTESKDRIFPLSIDREAAAPGRVRRALP